MSVFKRYCGLISGTMLACILAPSAAVAEDQDGDRKPTYNYSVAMPDFEKQRREGPLFERAQSAIRLASIEEGERFLGVLAPDAELSLFLRSGTSLRETPLTVEILSAANSSCLGPYSFDEGSHWAQLSFICPVDGASALSEFVTFRNSPELTLTIWFDGDKIEKINASEPLRVPMQRLVSMNAYDLMKESQ